MEKLRKCTIFSIKYLMIIVSILLLLIGVLSLFITARLDNTFFHQSENTLYEFSLGIIPLLIATLILLITFVLTKKILKKVNYKIILILILVACLFIFIGWISVLKLYPDADQKMIYDMAVDFNQNHNLNNHLVFGQYLYLYPFQIGLVLLVSHIFELLGQNFMYIEYLNALCSVANLFVLYKISQIVFDKKDQKTLLLLEAFFSLYWMFFNVHFYGNIIGLTFALLSIFLILKYIQTRKIRFIILSSICISISIIIKSNYLIFLCGILLYLLVDCFLHQKRITFVALAVFLAIYKLLDFGFDMSVKYIYKIDLPEGLPMITYVYMGMDEPVDKAPGWYNNVPKTIHDQNNGNNEAIVNSTKNLIIQRIEYFVHNPMQFISYYSQKIASTWLNPTFQVIWCSIPGNRYRLNEDYAHYLGYHEKVLSIVGGDLYRLEEKYFDALEIIVFIFSSISIYSISRTLNNNNNNSFFILPIIFLGGFVFHVLWETKAVYVLQYYFLLLPYTADGISKTFYKIFPPPNTTSPS